MKKLLALMLLSGTVVGNAFPTFAAVNDDGKEGTTEVAVQLIPDSTATATLIAVPVVSSTLDGVLDLEYNAKANGKVDPDNNKIIVQSFDEDWSIRTSITTEEGEVTKFMFDQTDLNSGTIAAGDMESDKTEFSKEFSDIDLEIQGITSSVNTTITSTINWTMDGTSKMLR